MLERWRAGMTSLSSSPLCGFKEGNTTALLIHGRATFAKSSEYQTVGSLQGDSFLPAYHRNCQANGLEQTKGFFRRPFHTKSLRR